MAVKTNVNQMVKRDGSSWRPEKTAAGDGNYKRYVAKIKEYVAKWPEIAYALKVIKNNLLWQSAGKYDSWPDFLRAEFDMSPGHANRLIDANDTRLMLEGSTSRAHGQVSRDDKTPDIPERNLRELGRLRKLGDEVVRDAHEAIKLKAVAAGRQATHADFKAYADVLAKKEPDHPDKEQWARLIGAIKAATAAANLLGLTDDEQLPAGSVHKTLLVFGVRMREAKATHGW